MSEHRILFSGFGGQGILFLGRAVANAALTEGKNVAWLPSYGPEMRGGTANCSVNISESEIGSPIITQPTALIAMNKPSYDKFIGTLEKGATAILDSSLITDIANNPKLNIVEIPATQLAKDNDVAPLANMIMLGKLISVMPFTSLDNIINIVTGSIPHRFVDLTERNIAALKLGYSY